MKTLQPKFGLLLIATLLLNVSVFASNDLSKKIEKSFKVKSGQLLKIDNQFGEINITNWDKSEVSLLVTIEVSGKNEEKTSKRLNSIDVEIEESSDLLFFKTIFNKGSDRKNNNSNTEMKINYTIKMPTSMALDLENKFGAVKLENFESKANIDIQFGSLKAGKLLAKDNEIELQFSKPAIIEQFVGGKIDLQFSKLEIGEVGTVDLNSKMSESSLDKVGEAKVDLEMGSIAIEETDRIEINSKMSSVKLEHLYQSAEIDLEHGSLKIAQLHKEFKDLDIKGSFSPIKIGVEKNAAFQIDASSKMAKLNLPNAANRTKEEPKKSYVNENEFIGFYGDKPSTEVKMKIFSSFGSVKVEVVD